MKATTAKRALHDVLFGHAALWILWLCCAFTIAKSPPEGDWFALREFARSFIAGDWTSLYSDRVLSSGTYFFRYPPFVLYLIAPLAFFPPMVAFALVCATQLVAAAFALLVLFRIRKPTEMRLNIVAAFGSAAMFQVIVCGQNSALLALVIAAAGFCWATRRDALAGVCIGLLACKPNWLPVFGAFVLWRGGLRAGAAMVLMAAALALSTYPIGAGVWHQFFGVTTRTGDIAAGYEAYKEITLLASIRSVFGWTFLTKSIWLSCLSLLAVLVIPAIRDGRSIARSIALITLLTVVANPYVSSYDGLVMIVPGTLWLAHRDEYTARTWRIVGAWIGAYWFCDVVVLHYWILAPVFGDLRLSVGGLLLTGWLVTEALARPMDARTISAAATNNSKRLIRTGLRAAGPRPSPLHALLSDVQAGLRAAETFPCFSAAPRRGGRRLLLVASTFMTGLHYFIDVLAGVFRSSAALLCTAVTEVLISPQASTSTPNSS